MDTKCIVVNNFIIDIINVIDITNINNYRIYLH